MALINPMQAMQSSLTSLWASVPYLLAKGEYWRFFTPALLHGNVIHLLANVRMWWGLRMVETWFGGLGYVFIIACSAAGSTAASYMFNPQGTVSIGASGVVCGLLGADFVVSRLGECIQVRRDRGQGMLSAEGGGGSKRGRAGEKGRRGLSAWATLL